MSILAEKRIGFIGAGNMAMAFVGGLVKSYLVEPERLIVSDISLERRTHLASTFGIRHTSDNPEVVRFADVVLLAVTPDVVGGVLGEIGKMVLRRQLVISICAGISTSFVESFLPNHPPVVRAMPNLPAHVGAGMAVVSRGAWAEQEHLQIAKAILGAVGEVLELEEKHMDAVTAVSGTGPAYFFFLMEAMEAAGLAEGLPAGVTTELVKQTALGAAKLCLASSETPKTLRKEVTSPGGTTEAALRLLDGRNVGQVLVQAIREAAKRSRELGK
jgi:pyrroline-5-carboxylate reductase